jgi:hypothetical protein
MRIFEECRKEAAEFIKKGGKAKRVQLDDHLPLAEPSQLEASKTPRRRSGRA